MNIINRFLTLIFVVFSFQIALSQSNFDQEITILTSKIISKLSKLDNSPSLAVWVFTDIDGNIMPIGKYISEQVSVKFASDNSPFQVMERNHLNTILKEHKLNADGLIDQNTAKKLGQFASVDFIITGMITILGDHINLTMKALNTETGFISASTSGDIAMDNNIRELLGLGQASSNRGFNGQSINSNENYNNSNSVSKECEINNTGDFCFQNNTKFKARVEIYNDKRNSSYKTTLTLQPGETQCAYNSSTMACKYYIWILGVNPNVNPNFPNANEFRQGQVLVEKCKSKTFVITR